MPLLGGVGRFLDKYLFGYALGTAAGPSLEPFVQTLANEAWDLHRVRPVEAEVAAALVAEGIWPLARGDAEAGNTGVDPDTFEALVETARSEPGVPLLLQLWRRGLIDDAAVDEALERGAIKARYRQPIRQLREVLLSPEEAANAWQQGFMSENEAEHEAELQGVGSGRSHIQRELAGLPPGAMDGLTLLRRGIVDEDTYRQIVREGHTKVKYTDALLALREQVLTATQWASLWLRGWVTEAQAKAGGALTGYGPDEMELLYKNQGRPATTRQVHIGWARGGRLEGAANEREAFEMAVRQSNVRTEYTDILWAQRYTYPSAFVLRALANDGTFSRDQTEEILVRSGWDPQYAALAADKWASAGSAGPGMKWADRARSRVFTEAWSDYLDGNADEPELRELLAAVGAAGAEQDTIVTLANAVRGRTRKDLTQAQILRLYRKGIWPLEQAQAALEDQGMKPDDAAALLQT